MATTTVTQTVLSDANFIGSIGVDTHVGYSWGSYNNLALMVSDLKYLGVTLLRDGFDGPTINPNTAGVLNGLASAGYKFDFVTPSNIPSQGASGLQQYLSTLDTFQKNHPGSILAVEGLNEVNIQAFSYNGSSSLSAAAAFQTAFYNAVKADVTLSGVSVYNTTLGYNNVADYIALGNLSGSSDFANVHAYASTSLTPSTALSSIIGTAATQASGNPFVITETGYTTQVHTPYLGIDESAEAKSILNTLVDAYKAGVSKTYIYELLDHATGIANDPEASFGLFNADGTPKLAATALHNLTTILADDGKGGHQLASTFTYSLDNMPATGSSMVLGKTNGATELVVWAEPKVWDAATQTDVVNPAQTVTVHLDHVHATVAVYDPLIGTTPIAVYSNVKDIQVPLSDHPIIIEIDGQSTGSGITPPAAVNVVGTASQIAAQLADLNSSTTMQTITLTDTHTLPVASEATMSYMISHYGKALAAIQGGYEFSVTTPSTNWSVTKVFNSAGTLASTTTSTFTNGVIQNKQTINADGSSDSLQYKAGLLSTENIVWSNGAKEALSYDTQGRVTADSIQNPDGSASTTLWTNGIQTNAYITNADKSFDAIAYNIQGQTYTTQTQHSNASGQVTAVVRTHADGTLDYTWTLRSNGDKLTSVYDASGHKTMEVLQTSATTTTDQYDSLGRIKVETIQNAAGSLISNSFFTFNADGTTATKTYSASGALINNTLLSKDGSTLTTFDTVGAKVQMDVKFIDGTRDHFTYAIKGQSYVTEQDHFDASGNASYIVRKHADGTLDSTVNFNADGSKMVNLYDAGGHKTTTDAYNPAGQLTKEIAFSANGDVTTTNFSLGAKTSIFVVHNDGSQNIQVLTNGVVTREAVYHIDKTQDIYVTNVVGQNYTTEHDHVNSAGKYDSIERMHADGTFAYRELTAQDGTTTKYIYDAAGHLIQQTVKAPNGTQELFKFDPAADSASSTSFAFAKAAAMPSQAPAVYHASYDASGHALSVESQNKDGGYTVTALSAGQTLASPNGVANDIFYSAGSTTIAFDHGNDQIVNFRAGNSSTHDVIQISKLLAADYSHLQLAQSGSDVLVHVTANDSILLKNTNLASLDHGNFLFA